MELLSMSPHRVGPSIPFHYRPFIPPPVLYAFALDRYVWTSLRIIPNKLVLFHTCRLHNTLKVHISLANTLFIWHHNAVTKTLPMGIRVGECEDPIPYVLSSRMRNRKTAPIAFHHIPYGIEGTFFAISLSLSRLVTPCLTSGWTLVCVVNIVAQNNHPGRRKCFDRISNAIVKKKKNEACVKFKQEQKNK